MAQVFKPFLLRPSRSVTLATQAFCLHRLTYLGQVHGDFRAFFVCGLLRGCGSAPDGAEGRIELVGHQWLRIVRRSRGLFLARSGVRGGSLSGDLLHVCSCIASTSDRDPAHEHTLVSQEGWVLHPFRDVAHTLHQFAFVPPIPALLLNLMMQSSPEPSGNR